MVTITITGANDAPVVTGAVDNGTVTEGPLPVMVAAGTIDFGDVDLTDAHVTTVTPGAGGYFGTFVANVTNASTGDGVGQVIWLFVADNVLRQVARDDQTLVQTYTVEIDDGHGGTVSQLVTITITGTNDAAVITGDSTGAVVEAGGVNNAIPGTPTDGGDLDATDVDDPPDSWTEVGTPTASGNGYGRYTIAAAGVWSYTLDNSHPTVQALPADGSIGDSFTVATIDGTEQVVVDHHHRSQRRAGGGGRQQRRRCGDRERGSRRRPVGGRQRADERHRRRHRRHQDGVGGQRLGANLGASLVGLYGALTLLADGTWSYVLDNADPDTDALAQGQAATDSFTYTIDDASGATATTTLTITITGTNDAPVVTGAVDTGTVTEELPPVVAVGTIDFGDVDLTDAHVTTVTPGASGYLGTFAARVTNDSTGDGVGQVSWLFEADNVLRTSLAPARCWCRPIRS